MMQVLEGGCTQAALLQRWPLRVATIRSVILATDVAYEDRNGLDETPDFRILTRDGQDTVAEDDLYGPYIATVARLPIQGVSA